MYCSSFGAAGAGFIRCTLQNTFSFILNPPLFFHPLSVWWIRLLIFFPSSLGAGWWTGSKCWESRTRETWTRTWPPRTAWHTWSRSAGNSSGLVDKKAKEWNVCSDAAKSSHWRLKWAWNVKANEISGFVDTDFSSLSCYCSKINRHLRGQNRT